MEQVHAGHSGMNSSLKGAREAVYWSGMTGDIRNYVKRCSTCNTFQNRQQREPLISIDVQCPWEKIGVDLFDYKGQ